MGNWGSYYPYYRSYGSSLTARENKRLKKELKDLRNKLAEARRCCVCYEGDSKKQETIDRLQLELREERIKLTTAKVMLESLLVAIE